MTNDMEQNREIEIARFIIEKTDSNLFLTGKAGTGKTTFLRDVTRYTKKKHVVLAPTGVAAVNAGAMTIHSFFQFGFGPYVKGVSVPEGGFMMRREKRELIKTLELIIIDEISMVRADLLDHISDELQKIRKSSEPFGGVQLLMIGDLQQLPPVVSDSEAEVLRGRYPSMYFFESKALGASDYHVIELETVYRQSDRHFIDMLNRARTGSVTRDDIRELNTHHDGNFRPKSGDGYIQLVTHNRMADAINRREMDALPSATFRYSASVTGTFPEDSFPTSRELEIRKGAQVMFVKNDPDRRFINGTIGEVTGADEDGITVRIPESGQEIRVGEMDWENIRYHLNEETHEIESSKIGSFRQYPLKPAWAITIHKSQGLTFDRAVIDAHAAFSPGQAYVALSRCRSLDGLVLSAKLHPGVFITDSVVDEYMAGALQDTDTLADSIGFEPFDYDRTAGGAEGRKADGTAAVVNAHVFSALREWRTRVAAEAGIPPFAVMHDRTLAGLSGALPETLSELESIHGLGPHKIERYGQEVLEVIHRSRNGSETRAEPAAAEPEPPILEPAGKKEKKERKARKEDTKVITYGMYRQGMSIAQIAQERSLVETTILGHLAYYVGTGEIDVHALVSDDTVERVSGFIGMRREEGVSMKEIYEHFNQTIPYGDIRLVMAHLEREGR